MREPKHSSDLDTVYVVEFQENDGWTANSAHVYEWTAEEEYRSQKRHSFDAGESTVWRITEYQQKDSGEPKQSAGQQLKPPFPTELKTLAHIAWQVHGAEWGLARGDEERCRIMNYFADIARGREPKKLFPLNLSSRHDGLCTDEDTNAASITGSTRSKTCKSV